ncbi:MAG: hypothetical protein A3A86_05285 [Elusimicrobia bacterium RIFCSPLOWO2_01_FULL_60_11]|nr:MAG: hypothetical protein A3A86_05285 [Elusimicrobia bacterium RIFCSPLOWO2_01_FULL_60_11]
MKVTMMLADFAQAIGGKLYIMGGGWSVTGPAPCPSAIAVKIEVPWNLTNQKHRLRVDLLDGDFHPVLVPTPQGEAPMFIEGNFEVGRPAGLLAGTPMDVALAFNIPPIPLEAGKRFIWKLKVNGLEDDDWQAAFSTRSAGQNPS